MVQCVSYRGDNLEEIEAKINTFIFQNATHLKFVNSSMSSDQGNNVIIFVFYEIIPGHLEMIAFN